MKRKLVLTLKGPMSPAVSRLPDDLIRYIDSDADRQLRTRSDIIRSMLVELCRIKGVVASGEVEDCEAAA